MITEQMLLNLRDRISKILSAKRFNHTLGVERAAKFLARKCLPQKVMEARAAALLHDITKELSLEEHLEIICRKGISLADEEKEIPALLHAVTATVIIEEEFSEFASEEILSAVAKHTTGDAYMTVLDKIVFLADFIEDSRIYPASKSTARFVKSSMKTQNIKANLLVLDRACVMEIDSTVAHLERLGKKINSKAVLARDAMISNI